MNRRGFLGTFGKVAAAALVLDPEKLLWRPAAKKIFIPSIDAGVSIFEPLTYYGWVQTQGIANVLAGNAPAIHLSPAMSQAVRDGSIAHVNVFCGESVQYVYVKCGRMIERGSVVAWVDHCKDEIRLAGPGDIPIGVKL